MTVTDRYFHVIPEVSYAEPQVYEYEDSYAEPLPLLNSGCSTADQIQRKFDQFW